MLRSFALQCSLMSLHEMSLLLSEELCVQAYFRSDLISVEQIVPAEFPAHSSLGSTCTCSLGAFSSSSSISR